MEEEEPTIGIFKEEENIEIHADDNNVSRPENPTNSSTPSVDEPSFCSHDIYDSRNWDNLDDRDRYIS
jgi:hypothetical protein